MHSQKPAITSASVDAETQAQLSGLAAGYNEAHAESDAVRQHWQYLLQSVDKMGPAAFQERQESVDRILRDEGATYNDYQDKHAGKAWALDPIPFLIDSHEWSQIEAAVGQRAELLNLILKDLYGPRTLLSEGVLPPELVFSHRGFLRACQNTIIPGEQQLIQYAADLVRGPDGNMRVLADRSQAPSGAGYALQNRTVMSRVFPSLLRDSHAHNLSLYFQSLRTKLNNLNPNGGAAQVVVLTPGAYNETYFEHVYLANYLGYALVQGSDLVVRDGYVWIKNLDGLNRVDVILRRVDDYFCDPVELRADSQLGVPGILDVVRSGRVSLANPLGSGVLENHGLIKYLPAIAKHFLGQDLAIESVKTYWCGDAKDCNYALDNLSNLVIKHSFRGPSSQITYGGELSQSQLADLKQNIQSQPLHFVAQEYIPPSLSPSWNRDKLIPRPTILRSYAVAGESSYVVMPGGLTRVGNQTESLEITNKTGSLSKDTWVLASEPERQISLIGSNDIAFEDRLRGAGELPSRVVENLFWAGRYAERAESALRLLRVVFNTLSTKGAGEQGLDQQMLLRAVTHLTATYPGFANRVPSETQVTDELLAVILDTSRPGSVFSSLNALLNATGQVKEFMSFTSQRICNDLRDTMTTLPENLAKHADLDSESDVSGLITQLRALAGSTHGAMMRGLGWHFMEAGRCIERVLQTVSLLRSLWVPAVSYEDQYFVLESVLLSAEALITYRRRYQRQMDIANGLDLLLLEQSNPRSIAFQLDELATHLQAIPHGPVDARISQEEAYLLEATTSLKLSDIKTLSRIKDGDFIRADLDQMLSRIQHLMTAMANSISDRHFDHSAGPQPLINTNWDDSL